jgi:hypothetical protein
MRPREQKDQLIVQKWRAVTYRRGIRARRRMAWAIGRFMPQKTEQAHLVRAVSPQLSGGWGQLLENILQS